jgi:hypothetical protein
MAWIRQGVRRAHCLDVSLRGLESGRGVVSGLECLRCLMCDGGRGQVSELLLLRHFRLRHGGLRCDVWQLHLRRTRLFFASWWEVHVQSLVELRGSAAERLQGLVRRRREPVIAVERVGWQEEADLTRWLVQGREV